MKIVSLLLCFFLALVVLNGCSTAQKIETLKPLPSDDSPMVYKTSTSFISMPLEISLKEIEHQLNKTLTGQIYDDSNLQDDKTEMKIWKTAPIKISEKDGKIVYILQIKGMICEMPMIEIDKQWNATGMKCGG